MARVLNISVLNSLKSALVGDVSFYDNTEYCRPKALNSKADLDRQRAGRVYDTHLPKALPSQTSKKRKGPIAIWHAIRSIGECDLENMR